jgi:hypothetical protein
MYRGEVPLLTRGSFATFYGGHHLLSSLSINPKPLSSVYPLGMGVILVSQILLILLKRKQLKSLEIARFQNRTNTDSYQTILKNILLSGSNNIYTLLGILVFTSSIGAYLALHYTSIQVNSAKEPATTDDNLHKNIVVFGSLLLGMNCPPFRRNKALKKDK